MLAITLLILGLAPTWTSAVLDGGNETDSESIHSTRYYYKMSFYKVNHYVSEDPVFLEVLAKAGGNRH